MMLGQKYPRCDGSVCSYCNMFREVFYLLKMVDKADYLRMCMMPSREICKIITKDLSEAK